MLTDPPGPGAWNMAVDEVLLEWAAEGGGCCFRLYRWDEPTLSLGFFQEYEDRWQHAASRDCPVIRRVTGGGAIVHDAELTYSLAVPVGHRLVTGPDTLYDTVHTSLIEILAEFGIEATLCGEGPDCRGRRPQPLLCFLRHSPSDVLVGRTKIAGSAQRRRRRAVLQHGSILLRRSPAAPQLGGIFDLVDGVIAEDELAEAWLARVSSRLGFAWRVQPLSHDECRRATALVDSRYGTTRWTQNR